MQFLYGALVFGIELRATEKCPDADTRAPADPNVPDGAAVAGDVPL
jgi:hypothetical protein